MNKSALFKKRFKDNIIHIHRARQQQFMVFNIQKVINTNSISRTMQNAHTHWTAQCYFLLLLQQLAKHLLKDSVATAYTYLPLINKNMDKNDLYSLFHFLKNGPTFILQP